MTWIDEYIKSLKMVRVEEAVNLVFYRPVAFLLVKSIYRTDITPNQISMTAIVMGVIAGCFLATGQPVYFVVGAGFYLAFNILDCSDGQLARMKKNGSPSGRIIDGVSDYIATTAVFLGIFTGFVLRSENQFYWFLLLLLAGISTVVHGILVDYYRSRYLDYSSGGRSNFENEIEEFRKEYLAIQDQKGKMIERIALSLYFRYSELQSLLVSRKRKTKAFISSSEEYTRKNKYIIRLWLILGPSSHVTAIVICSILNRFDILMWIIIAGFNSLAVMVWLGQKIIDSTFKRES